MTQQSERSRKVHSYSTAESLVRQRISECSILKALSRNHYVIACIQIYTIPLAASVVAGAHWTAVAAMRGVVQSCRSISRSGNTGTSAIIVVDQGCVAIRVLTRLGAQSRLARSPRTRERDGRSMTHAPTKRGKRFLETRFRGDAAGADCPYCVAQLNRTALVCLSAFMKN